jgi:hypothetical protein
VILHASQHQLPFHAALGKPMPFLQKPEEKNRPAYILTNNNTGCLTTKCMGSSGALCVGYCHSPDPSRVRIVARSAVQIILLSTVRSLAAQIMFIDLIDPSS